MRKRSSEILKFSVLAGLLGLPVFVFGLSCSQDSDCPADQYCRSSVCVYQSPGTAVSITIEALGGQTPTPTPPPGTLPPPPQPGEAVFKGMAYPDALITILKQGQVAATFLSDNKGYFEKKLTGLIEAPYLFGIFAEDSENRKSLTLNFTLNIFWETKTTLSNIFIPPTISLAKSQIPRGDILDIKGQIFPESEVHFLISPGPITKIFKSDSSGKWLYALDTSDLLEKTYQVKAKGVLASSQQSEFSQSLSFLVGRSLVEEPTPTITPKPLVCRGADLNFDGKVNLVDFSILLYWWNGVLPSRTCADITGDNRVDIVDFSIMMYYWTG